MDRNSGAEWRAPRGAPANDLLRALHKADAEILRPSVKTWWGQLGDVLFEPGAKVDHVYFPCGASLVSYVVVLDDGRSIEVSLIGREGAAGGILSQRPLRAFTKAKVQFAGPFLRIGVNDFEEAKSKSLTLRHTFTRYADCLLAQIFQAVACNATHSIEQRTAKWLIHTMERTGATALELTQEQLAAMLGVGRTYISRIIASLKQRKIVETRRGSLIVMDANKLERLSCACNDQVRRHFDQVLGRKSTNGSLSNAKSIISPGGLKPLSQ